MSDEREAVCAECAAPFTSRIVRLGWTKFCSQACYYKYRSRGRVTRTCPVCAAEYTTSPSRNRKTCGKRSCASEMKSRGKIGDKNPTRRHPESVARGQAKRAADREAALRDVPIGPRREVCERPGCCGLLTGQVAIYCSPACHYLDRGRVGLRSGGYRRIDFVDGYPGCRVAGCGNQGAHTHHVVYRQHVERAGGDHWHPDNALRLCVEHHGNAHGARRLPLGALRQENIEFAFSLLGPAAYNYLIRYYQGTDLRVEAALTWLVGLLEAYDRKMAA